MSEGSKFSLTRDTTNRMSTELVPESGLFVGIRHLSETDDQRVRFGVRAYGVLDIPTALGELRCRDIRIKWSDRNERFYIQWRQWPTGKWRRTAGAEDKKEFLDVCGPLTKETRARFNDVIVDVYNQILEEAAAGTLGRANSRLADLAASMTREGDPVDEVRERSLTQVSRIAAVAAGQDACPEPEPDTYVVGDDNGDKPDDVDGNVAKEATPV